MLTSQKTKQSGTSANLLTTTLKFMGAFVAVTLLFLIVAVLALVYLSADLPLAEYAPVSQVVDYQSLNWDKIHDISGEGRVLNEAGQVIWTSQAGSRNQQLTTGQVLDHYLMRDNDRSTMTYKTSDGNWLLLTYPVEVFEVTPQYSLNSASDSRQQALLGVIGVAFLVYLFLVYLAFSRLYRQLEDSIHAFNAQEEEGKRFFFRGLAHDIKTPLSTLTAYSRALADGIVAQDQQVDYLETIYHQSLVLKDRVDDMVTYASLEDQVDQNLELGDLLEAVRRYIGENYTWYLDHQAQVEIVLADDQSYQTPFEPVLFNRLLQNIMTNAVDHNEPGVVIRVDWSSADQCLIITDSGPGVPSAIHDTLFEPMVTSDTSRTGDKSRGMGLAIVKRIVDLHGWKIVYQEGFRIYVG